ncbi:hypothetical protein [Flavobacterium aurantiibacter]|uniref:Uncharacterized protein n=1 Tax=Flavobacterium aurantiibacter TaxID=2023067 RepID=A0A255ZGL0_9FLAO|nr:hypothetical protein [Flavobacterium aurantiibacter]OYQ40569.1 hypothetical protein CHX27_13690 [Flavobacterium aurantiibacter]
MLVDPDGRSAKAAAEPPVNGLEYFRDDTGEYFWNQNKNAYDHFQNKDGNGSVYQGIYRADTFKEPVGEYTIIFDLSNAKPKDEYKPEHTINRIAVPLMAALVKAGNVKDISNPDLYPGVKIYSSEYMNGALTAGNVIFTNPRMESVLDLGHEYGHYLDYKYHFKFNASEYIKKIAIPSFKSAMKASIPSFEHIHESSNSEKRANRLGGAWTGEIKLKNLFRK